MVDDGIYEAKVVVKGISLVIKGIRAGSIAEAKAIALSELDDGLGIYASQGGHHPMAKSAFKGISEYDYKQALTISQAKLDKFGVDHATITGQQKTLYAAFAKSGDKLTLNAMRQIEIEALTNAGVPLDYATHAVDKAIDALIKAGVTNPSRIPWSK